MWLLSLLQSLDHIYRHRPILVLLWTSYHSISFHYYYHYYYCITYCIIISVICRDGYCSHAFLLCLFMPYCSTLLATLLASLLCYWLYYSPHSVQGILGYLYVIDCYSKDYSYYYIVITFLVTLHFIIHSLSIHYIPFNYIPVIIYLVDIYFTHLYTLLLYTLLLVYCGCYYSCHLLLLVLSYEAIIVAIHTIISNTFNHVDISYVTYLIQL